MGSRCAAWCVPSIERRSRAVWHRTRPTDSTYRFVTRSQLEALPDPIEVLSYEFTSVSDEQGRRRVVASDRPRTYRVPYYGRYAPTSTVPFPAAYLFPAQLREVAEKLVQHGVVVEMLAQPCTLSVDVFHVQKLEATSRPYQGHYLVTLTGSWQGERKVFAPGDFLVDTAQPLAPLIGCLLEPESDDGLCAWNFFDRYLYVSQWASQPASFPVSKAVERPKVARRVWQTGAGR